MNRTTSEPSARYFKESTYSSTLHSTLQSTNKIVAVVGGKGGVGKTITTILLGAACAQKGKRVVIFDADWNGANMHTCLGINEPKRSIVEFKRSNRRLRELLVDTHIPGLQMICGSSCLIANKQPSIQEKRRLISELRQLPADLVLIDLGASNNFHVIDFFLAADIRLIVTTPEITAIQDAFYFIKLALLRRLSHAFNKHPNLHRLLHNPSDVMGKTGSLSTRDIVDSLDYYEPGAKAMAIHMMRNFRPGLILNMVREKMDQYEIHSLKIALEELLQIHPRILASIEYQATSRHSRELLAQFNKKEGIYTAFDHLAQILLKQVLSQTILPTSRKRDHNQNRSQISQDLICSIRCPHWNDCNYQNGGIKCDLYHLQATI